MYESFKSNIIFLFGRLNVYIESPIAAITVIEQLHWYFTAFSKIHQHIKVIALILNFALMLATW
jgi:hypothetical protein